MILLYNQLYIQFFIYILCSSVYSWINNINEADTIRLNLYYSGRVLLKINNLINKIPYIKLLFDESDNIKYILYESIKYKLFIKKSNKISIDKMNQLLDNAIISLSPSERILVSKSDTVQKYRNAILTLSKNNNLNDSKINNICDKFVKFVDLKSE